MPISPTWKEFYSGHVVRSGDKLHKLRAGKPLAIPIAEIDAFMAKQNIAGLIVLKDGKIRLERYARGYSLGQRWTSFSVAKSITSMLVGAAIKDGYIGSVNEPVTKYIPELADGGYDGVTIEQLLTMTSGVKWNEDYADPKSDVARMFFEPVPAGEDPTIHYMKNLPRDTTPGTHWVYKTGETNLIGVLVRRATRKPLAAYLSEKIWKPYGMERDAVWLDDANGNEVSGCCLSASLRDFARLGQFVLDDGKSELAIGWLSQSTRPHVETGAPGYGYGYQWWTFPEGRFGALGIFGQSITIDPRLKVVIAISAAAARATDDKYGLERTEFLNRLFDAAAKL